METLEELKKENEQLNEELKELKEYGCDESWKKKFSNHTVEEILDMVDENGELMLTREIGELRWGCITKEEMLEWRKEYKKLLDDSNSHLYKSYENRKNWLERERETLIKKLGTKKYEEQVSSHSIQSESEYFHEKLNDVELDEYGNGSWGSVFYTD
tara:strand:+ start:174 stop:644 length:471 start_codon:yes stop_codon:yes gene_type:complete